MGTYDPSLSCLDLGTSKWAHKPKGWIDAGMPPTATELHYLIAPAVLVNDLNEANDNKGVA